jgi:STE24 endopeptidase
VARLDAQRQERARQYARMSRRLWLFNTLLGGAYALAWLVFGWSLTVRAWLESLSPALENPWLLVPAFVAVFGGVFLVIDLPLGYYGGFVLPHRFGQSTQTRRAWIMDQLRGMLIGLPIGLVVLEAFYFCLGSTGDLWWLWAAAGMLLFNVLMVNLAPILIMPLFNRYVPLGEEHRDLAERLLALTRTAGTYVQGVYKFDMSRRTKAANAALTGIGKTRRIILGDTLISEFTPDEVETVLAHELGHHVHRDIALLISMGALTTLGGFFVAAELMDGLVAAFGFEGVSDPAALPALALVLGVFGLITMPLENAFSRWREGLADQYALRATGKSEAFASAMIRLANQNLGEVDPERWVVCMFYSHPPLGQRIEAARNWQARRPA